ncbi:hypothetical protein SAMN04488540_104134 [Ferrimonas sediminum]|uniref:Uncharacterized protein n=1 Tax=Ferrimonas sediminum TaxID=718193 RepID=A0A1G8PZ15_9GAMM|nr:magnetosome protein MamC [Ferrimonas sediminum]SDI97683.1 hypothetical protein SAMN04488540_104134 [Ferrimonas sediminum]
MSNGSNQLSPASRTMIASALLGGTASAVSQWSQYQSGELAVNDMTTKVLKDAAKAGLAGGVATAVAGQMAGRPVLSLATVLCAGAASLYLIDELMENRNEQNT